ARTGNEQQRMPISTHLTADLDRIMRQANASSTAETSGAIDAINRTAVDRERNRHSFLCALQFLYALQGTMRVNAAGSTVTSQGVKPAGSPSHWMGTGTSELKRTFRTRMHRTSGSFSCCLRTT